MRRPSIIRDPHIRDSANAYNEVFCPVCGAPAVRIRRRLRDRVASLFFLRHRYRCADWACRWESTLRVESQLPALKPTEPSVE